MSYGATILSFVWPCCRSLSTGRGLFLALFITGCITINKNGDDDDDDWGDGAPTTSPSSPFGSDGNSSDNSAPQAEIVSHSHGDYVLEDTVVMLLGSVSDGEDASTDLQVRWLSDERVLCGATSPSADNLTTCETTLWDSGDITLEVTDTDGATATDSISLTVGATEAPNADILSPSSGSIYYTDHPIAFTATVSDAEDYPEHLTVEWSSDLQGDLSIDGFVDSEGMTQGFALLEEGEHTLQFTVTDTTGKSGHDSVVISVGPENHAPDCTIVSPTNGDVIAGDSGVEFVGLVSDPDVPASMLAVMWYSDRIGMLHSSSPSSDGEARFVTADLSAGTHMVTLEAEDELGATCSDSVTIRIEWDDTD